MSYTAPSSLNGSSSGLNGSLTWNPSTDSSYLLLLHFDGNITDSSVLANAMTLGSASLTTSNPKFGSGALAVGNGAFGSYGLESPTYASGSALDIFSTTAWTIQGWAFVNAANSTLTMVSYGDDGAGGVGPVMQIGLTTNPAGTSITAFAYDYSAFGTATTISVSASYTVGTYVHLALVSSGGSVKIYLNGTTDPSTGVSVNWTPAHYTWTTGRRVCIGSFSRSSPASSNNGQIDEFSVSNKALYTSNFTPPTSPGGPPPGYDVYRNGVSIATFLGTPGYADTAPALGTYNYQVFAWDGTSDVSAGSNIFPLSYISSTTVLVYGKFAPAKAYPPTLLINADGIRPQIYMPHENTTVQA